MQRLSSRGIEDPVVEKSFVASLLQNPKHLNKIAVKLPPDGLVEPDCQAMYLAMLNLSARKTADFSEIAMCDELLKLNMYNDVGKRDGVEKFYTYSKVGNPVVLGDIVLDLHSRRLEIDLADLMHARAQDRTLGKNRDNDMAGRMAAYQAQFQEIQRLFCDDERSLPSSEFSNYYERLMNRRIANLGQPRMNFKWGDLNRLSPSFVDGDLIIMVAESGAGKTTLMADQAEYLWKRGYHVLFYHLELNTDKMADRRIARATGIPMRVLQDGRAGADGSYTYLTDSETQAVRAAIADQAAWPGSMTLKHCPGWTMAQICGDMRVRCANGPVDFILVDYFNKVKTVAQRGSYLTHDMGSDVELLKVTLEELWIVGMMAAQMDKQSKKSSGYQSVASARGSGELDDKSSIGMWMDRPINPADGRRGPIANVYLTKVNSGQEGMVQLRFDGPRFRLCELTTTEPPDDFEGFQERINKCMNNTRT